MPFGARVWRLGKGVALVAALIATFFVSLAVSMRMALRAGEVSVPTLAGVTVNDATATLADLGLTLRVDDAGRPDDRVPSGRIMQQDPPAGIRARRQRSVRVWLSTGPRAAVVPRVIGQTERTARIRLEQGEMTIDTTSEIHSTDYPPDTVIAQTPDPDTAGTRVRLLVNRGEPAITYVMPNLAGTVGEQAAEVLRQQGLRVAVVATVPVLNLPPGTVTQQTPA
ncbi:MAG TPA: PASTA domain-containing protein, partial [Vicinamibacterales bacterium]